MHTGPQLWKPILRTRKWNSALLPVAAIVWLALLIVLIYPYAYIPSAHLPIVWPCVTGSVPESEEVNRQYQWLKKAKSKGHVPEMYEQPTEFRPHAFYAGQRGFGPMFAAYQSILLACNAVDYDDMLSLVRNPVARANGLPFEAVNQAGLVLLNILNCQPSSIRASACEHPE